MKRQLTLTKYLLRRNRTFFAAILISAAAAMVLLQFPNFLRPLSFSKDNLLTGFSNMVYPISSVATFIVAVIVFLAENRQEWESNLPKRLTVNFILGDHLVLRCEDAFLASESEIRTWGQQIGSQMCRVQRLNFGPKIIVNKQNRPQFDPNEKKLVKKYEATFFLFELPETKSDQQQGGWDQIWMQGRTLLWKAPSFKDITADYTVEVGDYSVNICAKLEKNPEAQLASKPQCCPKK